MFCLGLSDGSSVVKFTASPQNKTSGDPKSVGVSLSLQTLSDAKPEFVLIGCIAASIR
jgi:hypothetical protein